MYSSDFLPIVLIQTSENITIDENWVSAIYHRKGIDFAKGDEI